jgi:excisionase family DNA binding protein
MPFPDPSNEEQFLEQHCPDAVTALVFELRELKETVREFRQQLSETTKPLLTVEEVAELVGRAAYTVRSWISAGKINAIRVSGTGPRGRLLIPRSELEKLIRDGKAENVPPTAVPVD